MRLLVLTPDGILLERTEVGRARLRLADGGELGIRPGHHPLVAETAAGSLRFGGREYDQEVELQAGILEIDREGIVIFTRGWLDQAAERMALKDVGTGSAIIKEYISIQTHGRGRSGTHDGK